MKIFQNIHTIGNIEYSVSKKEKEKNGRVRSLRGPYDLTGAYCTLWRITLHHKKYYRIAFYNVYSYISFDWKLDWA